MACLECEAPTISFAVPAECREYTPEAASGVEFCTRCLTLEPVDSSAGRSDDQVDFSRISDSFPAHPERAIPLALALGLCQSLATNRSAIESLLREVERAGTDPLLVMDRLGRDPSIEPAFDLERRTHQIEQLLY
ncbi:DUF6276 family protein [Natrialba swarupiae]|uniref:Small CPxCG-related zinc finger protein n=1 Tax=Natrialba swarupiae TaxID=2448032 RepID=A0A5D5AMH8_9EURY|nr:DUF6276 family protein [Natrialba swarupiae]MCW8172013.1 hypothetical protein [Natrialba swarupiae]TYT62077.1 hypothetical protein FYC77_10265 [Natrialba swarupiae]